MIKLKHIIKAIILTSILITSFYVSANNNADNDKIKKTLYKTAQEVDRMFGNKVDEYTIITGASFNDTINQFIYYYAVSPDIWEDLLYSTEELKYNIKQGIFNNNDLTSFIDILIQNNTTLNFNYECKNEYIDIIFSVDELKKLK